jgi:hypothetical protein
VADGAPEAAIEELAPAIARLDERGQLHQLTESLLVFAEAHVAAHRWGDAIDLATRGVEATDRDDQASVRWQFRLVLAMALDAGGRPDDAAAERNLAAAEVHRLAERIADPEHRRRFVDQLDDRRWQPW